MILSDAAIRKLKPEAKQKKYTDGEGLTLIVNTNGTKLWRLRYRHAGKAKELSLGVYPEVSLLEARDKKIEARRMLREKKDPIGEKKEAERVVRLQELNSFKSIAEEWYELKQDKWSERQRKNVKNRLKNHVYPFIGNRPINEIRAVEFLNIVIRELEKEGRYETAHKVLQYSSAIFRLAVITERTPYNPLADLRGALKSYKQKNLPTISIKELPEFLHKLEGHRTARINKLAIKLLMLTFVRPGELRRAKWDYFDFKQNVWRIPAELMKKGLEHWVPLSQQALAVLEEIKSLTGGCEYLFPTKNKLKHPFMNENVINEVIRHDDMGYKKRLVGHGFRSLASTTLNELGYRGDVIEKQLAHEEANKVRAAYNRAQYWEERIKLMQGWADHIDFTVLEWENKKLPRDFRFD